VIHDIEADRAVLWRRNRLDWDKYLQEMRHSHFRSMFRMSHACFLTILDKIGTFMERHLTKSENAGGYISRSMQLGMALRFCAGGFYLDIHDRYGVSSSSFYSLVFACLELIVEHYPIVFPTDPAGFKELAAGFRQRQHEHMRVFLHALGALDGIRVPTGGDDRQEVYVIEDDSKLLKKRMSRITFVVRRRSLQFLTVCWMS
jgi:hypothetical protein